MRVRSQLGWAFVALGVVATACRPSTILDEQRYTCSTQQPCAPGFVCIDGECLEGAVPVGLDAGADASVTSPSDGGDFFDAGTAPDAGVEFDAGTSDAGVNERPDAGVDAGSIGSCRQDGGCVNGTTCSDGAECRSGFCIRGLCCSSACNSGCGTCTEPGFVGTCRPFSAGTACGVYRCNGVSESCPSACTTSFDCAAMAACCLTDGGDRSHNDCRAMGQGNTCFQFAPIATFREDFETPLNPIRWNIYSTPKSSIEAGVGTAGRLVMGWEADGGPTNTGSGVISFPRFSLFNSSCTIEVVDATETWRVPTATAFFKLTPPQLGNDYIGFDVNTSLVAGVVARNGPRAPDAGLPPVERFFAPLRYDPRQMRFLRIKSTNGVTVDFEYSDGGANYTTYASVVSPFPLTDLRISVGIFARPNATDVSDAGSMTIVFDNINLNAPL